MAITPAGLRDWRLRLGLSQAEAARVAGVSRGLVAEAERGRRTGERTLARLALALRDHEARTGSTSGPPGGTMNDMATPATATGIALADGRGAAVVAR